LPQADLEFEPSPAEHWKDRTELDRVTAVSWELLESETIARVPDESKEKDYFVISRVIGTASEARGGGERPQLFVPGNRD